MKAKLGLIILLHLSVFTIAQHKLVRFSGTVVDTTASPLTGATIVLLQASDSVMYGFTTSDKNGHFTINKIEPKEYLLKISFVGYSTFNKRITVTDSNEIFDVGTIELYDASHMLGGVDIVADAIPIMLKGDTIEYNAGSFKTQANATVEDLLKKLPGVEVDREGNIKAQGENVAKVLVDGKEFFGNDPKIASKNLPADAIDKVQVFDQMSEASQFTGIDDGDREKTINLALKEDKKKGVFGNISGAYAWKDLYRLKGNINKFDKKMQLTVLGSANNVNENNFSFGEMIDIMGGPNGMGGFQGGQTIINGPSFGSNNSTGINTTASSGINFNYQISKNTDLRTSYFYNRLSNELNSNSFRQNFLNTDIFTSTDEKNQLSLMGNHRLNLRLNHKFSEKSDLIITSSSSITNNEITSLSLQKIYGTQDELESSADRKSDQMADNLKLNARLQLRQKFDKAGRSLVSDLSFGNTTSNTILDLFSENVFRPYDDINGFTNILNQIQEQENNEMDLSGKVSYTEPLGNNYFLQMDYEYKNYNTDFDKDFFDLENGERIKNLQLSDLYNRDFTINLPGLTLNRTRTKSNLNVGVQYQDSELKGRLNSEDRLISRGFNALLPSFSYRYEFTTTKSIGIRYRTSLNEPSLQQLQPQVNNEDPLDIYEGNPELQAEYRNNLNISFNSYDAFSYVSLFASLNAFHVSDKITNNRTIDEYYVQKTRPENVDYDRGLMGFISFGAPLAFVKSQFRINAALNMNETYLYVNEELNKVRRSGNSYGITIENKKKEHLDWSFGANFSYNTNTYELATELNQNYLQQTYFAEIVVFHKKWTLAQNFDYNLFTSDAFPDQNFVPLYRVSLSRTFLKADRGELKISGFDIFNQNQGIRRNSNVNYIEELNYNVLQRYIMFSFTYRLSALKQDSPGIIIKTR